MSEMKTVKVWFQEKIMLNYFNKLISFFAYLCAYAYIYKRNIHIVEIYIYIENECFSYVK